MSLTPDEKHEAYTQGFEAGKEHSQPSPETRRLIEKMQENFGGSLKRIEDVVIKMQIENAKNHTDFKNRLENIEMQTTKTNGRVNTLEEINIQNRLKNLESKNEDNDKVKRSWMTWISRSAIAATLIGFWSLFFTILTRTNILSIAK